jgi:hypothetical protein
LKSQVIFVTALLVAGIMAGSSFVLSSGIPTSSTSRNSVPNQPPYPAWLTSASNEISISQLAAAYSAYNLTLNLPSWLPTGYSVTSVHVPDVADPYGYAIIACDAHGDTDPLTAGMALQVIPGNQPSQSDLEATVSSSGGSFQLVTVAGVTVLLNPQAQNGDLALQAQFGSMSYAQFWKDGVYYQARIYSPLATTDLLAMIASLQPSH